jgi:DNA adenine methylase
MNNNFFQLKKLKPIVKWSGGKSDEIQKFIDYIPKENIDLFIEPFAGGASVFFYLTPKKAVINDVHTGLITLYKEIKKGNANKIYDFMQKYPNEEKKYYKVRDEIAQETSLDVASRFYYLRKTCYRGMLRYNKKGKFNIPYGRYKTCNCELLKNKDYEILLKNTEITCQDFTEIFKKYNSEKTFMFLDPPYDSKFTDYGYCKFEKQKQEELAECFKNTDIKCLMIIGKTPFIENLYSDYIVGEYPKKYRFKLHSGRVGDEINRSHLIIKNYDLNPIPEMENLDI